MVNAYNKAIEAEQKAEAKGREKSGEQWTAPSTSSMMSQSNSMLKQAMGNIPKYK